MDSQKAKAIWESIILEANTPTKGLQDGEMTLKMFMDMSGFGKDKAREILNVEVQRGKLEFELRYLPDRRSRCLVWSPILN